MEEQALLDKEQALLDNGRGATESSLGEVLPVALLKESSLHLHTHTQVKSRE
jgi:hypothetical protein